MIPRHITQSLLEALADTPVVLLNGARQTGKSTLTQWLASSQHSARYLTLDHTGVLAAAREDPQGFVAGLEGPIVLDEVQRVPELFLAIKAQVDQNRQSGRFLLTGSADVLLLPKVSETLAGRMEILTLWPLSQGELERVKEGFVDAIFGDKALEMTKAGNDRQALLGRIQSGGYPEVLSRTRDARRGAWFRSYITTILQRDIRDLSNIEGLTALPTLLSLLASRVTSLLNFSELSRSIAIPMTTLKRYLALLETAFLIQTVPSWSTNLGKRLVKSRKLLLNDTGLISHLLGIDARRLSPDETLPGPLMENFVIMELKKQMAWSNAQVRMFHYRTLTGRGIDIILESPDGRIVPIEIKARATVRANDFGVIRDLRKLVGTKLHRGIVLYTGQEIIPFGPGLHAMPVSALWQLGAG